MQPHKGLSSKDSFGVCQEVDIFSHIRSPKQPLKRGQATPFLDTLQSEQEEIGRLILEKPVLRPIYFLAKNGKSLAVFILFPFHFFLFRTPKWAITKLFPVIFKISSKISSKSKEYLNRLMQEVALRLSVINHMRQNLKAFAPILKYFFKETAHYLTAPFTSLVEKIKGKIEIRLDHMKLAFFTASDKFKRVFSPFKKMGSLVKKAALLTKASEKARSLNPSLKNAFQAIEHTVDSFINQVRSQLKAEQKKMEKRLLKATKLKEDSKFKALKLREIMRELKEALQNKILELKDLLKEMITPKIEGALLGVQKVLEVLNYPFAFVAASLQQWNEKNYRYLSRQARISQFLKSCKGFSKKVLKTTSVQEAILRSFQRIFQESFAYGKNVGNKIKKKILKSKEKVKQQLIQKGKLASKFLLSKLKRLIHHFITLWKKIVQFFFLVFKWIRIMAKFTYYLGQEIIFELQTL